MTADEFEAAGLYDPTSPRAAERLELLEWLAEQGISVEEIRARVAVSEERLYDMAGTRALRTGVKYSLRDVMAAAGVDAATMEEMRRAVGYVEVDEDVPVFNEQDLEGFHAFVLAQQLFSVESVVAFTRTLGSSLARIADAANSMFIADVEAELVERGASELERAQANLDAVRLLDGLPPSIEAIFRIHMQQAIERSRRARGKLALESGTDLAIMAIGFVDLSGYTSLSRALGARDLSTLVARFEAIASDAALAHDGRVVKLIGDAVMYASVEPAEAVGVARDLVGEFAPDPEVRPHGGIAFGEVLARGGDYYGPVVNLAARLAEVAIPGEVLVTAEIAQSVEGVEPAGRRMLKGFDQPVELFSFTG